MFYDRLKELCDIRGTTPTTVCRLLGIDSAVVANWKKRGNTPKARTLQALAEYFGMSIDQLLYGEETEHLDPRKYLKDKIDGMSPEELERFEGMLRLLFPEKFG